jgi:hypothetical protein
VDLLRDLRDDVTKQLPYDETDAALAAELSSLPLGELVARFFNWLERLIHPHPRQVLESQQFIAQAVPALEQAYLERIIEKIAAGADLNSHLSRGIIHGFIKEIPPPAKKNLGRRRDLDLLLNEWGIHHLHLPDVLDSDGFVRRDPTLDKDLLLFAMFRPERAYLLDVLPHGVWTKEGLVEVAVRNWPDAGLFITPKGVVRLSQTTKERDRQKLRSAGVSAFIEIDGKVFYGATGGLTSAGTSLQSTRRAHHLLNTLADLHKKLDSDPQHLRPQVESAGKTYPENPEFHLIFARMRMGWGFAIREAVSGTVIPIDV